MRPGEIAWLWNFKAEKPVPGLILSKSCDSKSLVFGDSKELFTILYEGTILELPFHMVYKSEEACTKDFFKSVIF